MPPIQDLLILIAAMAGAGVFAGLIAGLFGVGGGTVLVPALFYAFGVFGLGGEANLHVAVGTSLSTIITTSLRSVAAHRKHGAVDEPVLKGFIPWIALGAIIGAVMAGFADKATLGLIYGAFAIALAAYMGLGKESWTIMRDVPTGPARAGVGTGLGAVSALMGIGGGQISTMLMTFHNRPIHQAVATSSGLGVLISIPGALGFIYAGWPKMDVLPPLSLGYVSLIGFILFIPTSIWTAPIGARLAHRLSKRKLEVVFGLFLLIVAARFIWTLLH
jgi:uncharacterized membrane protein YfcA